MNLQTSNLLHDLTNSVCAMVGAADTLAAHHDDLTAEQRETLASCLHRQSDVLRTLLTGLREGGLEEDTVRVVERPDARETVEAFVDLVSVDDEGAVVMQLRDRDVR